MGVVGFIRGSWVHSGAPLGSFGLCGVDAFTCVCAGGRWIHPGSLCSLQCAQGVFRFNLGRSVYSCAPWMSFGHPGWHTGTRSGSSGSSWVIGFTQKRTRCRWVYFDAPWGLLGSCAVVGFMRSGTPWGSLGSSGVVGFSRVRSSVVVGFNRVRPGGRWVHPESLGSLRSAMGIVWFIRGPLVHSMQFVGFTRLRHGGRWVHPGSLGSRGFALGFNAFIMHG